MGVKEYWIIDPKLETITIHDFISSASEGYGHGEIAQSFLYPEIKIRLDDLFA